MKKIQFNAYYRKFISGWYFIPALKIYSSKAKGEFFIALQISFLMFSATAAFFNKK